MREKTVWLPMTRQAALRWDEETSWEKNQDSWRGPIIERLASLEMALTVWECERCETGQMVGI